MTKDSLSKLFTAFTKISKDRHLNKEGVGLGLAISKNLAVAFGGDIEAKSEAGKGSEFTLVLPYDFPNIEMKDSDNLLTTDYVNSRLNNSYL